MATKKSDDTPEQIAARREKAKAEGLAKKAAKANEKDVKASDLPPEEKRPARLRNFYKKEVVPALMKEFSLKNPMQVPQLKKIVINMGLGEAVRDPKVLEAAAIDMTKLAGQKPVLTAAKKSIATYKLREGMNIGCMVTLRRDRMWEFYDRLVNLGLPRVRDFRGVPAKMDGRGNYSLGLKEQIIFSEIDYDKVDKLRGMNITFVTSAINDEQCKALLTHLGMPFKK
ncbi:MAG: 50S ribosomal protein L5 [Deltaproteobacteria bacterium]|nr:50S ribosomal protein L5 [Deltaproteobacteria bacterium]